MMKSVLKRITSMFLLISLLASLICVPTMAAGGSNGQKLYISFAPANNITSVQAGKKFMVEIHFANNPTVKEKTATAYNLCVKYDTTNCSADAVVQGSTGLTSPTSNPNFAAGCVYAAWSSVNGSEGITKYDEEEYEDVIQAEGVLFNIRFVAPNGLTEAQLQAFMSSITLSAEPVTGIKDGKESVQDTFIEDVNHDHFDLVFLPALSAEFKANPAIYENSTADEVKAELQNIKYIDASGNETPLTADDVTITMPDTMTAGTEAEFTVTYSGVSTTVSATPAAVELTGLEVTTQPALTYESGQALNLANMKVKATYNHGSPVEDYKNYTASPADGTVLTVAENNNKPVTLTDKTNTAITTTTSNLTVTPKFVKIPTADGTYSYTGDEQTFTVGNNSDAALYSMTGSVKGTDAANYSASAALKDKTETKWSDNTTADKTLTWTITPAECTYAVPTAQDIKEGSGLSAITAPEKATGVKNEDVPGTLSWYSDSNRTVSAKDTDLTNASVGSSVTLYWKFDPTSNNYADKNGSTSFTIIAGDPQTLTFAENKDTLNKTYGDAAFTNAVTVTSNNNPITDGGEVTYTSSNTQVATVDSNGQVTILAAGETTITATAAAVSGKYAEGTAQYTLVVGKKPVTITGLTASNKEYDGTAAANLSGNAVLDGVLDADSNVALSDTGSASFNDKNVGQNKTVTFSGYALTGDGADNYDLSQPAQQTADITAKSVTINGLSASDKTYDGETTATATGTAAVSDVVQGDTVTVQAGTASFADKNVGTDKAVTFAGYSLTGADAGNYTLTAQPVSVTANITAKSVTITGLSAENKTYDGTTTVTVTGTPAISGKVNGDTVSVQAGSAAFADKNAGTNKTVTFTDYSLTGADAGNYSLSQPAGIKASITAKPVTITGLSAEGKTYDGNTAATVTGTAVIEGKLDQDTVTVKAGTASFDDANVGSWAVTFTGYSLEGTDAGNYSLRAQPASVTATISASDSFLTYAVNDQQIAVGSGLNAIVAPEKATGQDSKEYTGTLTWYTTDAHTTHATDTDLSQLNVGNEVTLYWTFDPNSDNFTDLTGAAKFTIVEGEPQNVSFANASVSKTYGDPAFTNAVSVKDKNSNPITDGGNVTYQSSNTDVATVADNGQVTIVGVGGGPITITATAASVAGKYAEGKASYTLTVTPKFVRITGLSVENKTYDGTVTASVKTENVAFDGIVAGDVLALKASTGSASFSDKNVGTNKTVTFTGYQLDGKDAAKYTLTQGTNPDAGQPASAKANITAKSVTITGLSASDKTYDGETAATVTGTAAVSDVVQGDTVTVKAGTASFANKNVGQNKTVTFTGYSLEGADARNYTLSAQPSSVTASITAKSVTINGLSASNKTYDGTTNATPTGTPNVNGKAQGDTVNVQAGTASFSDKNVGTGKTVTFSGYSLTGADAGNYNLTAQPDSVTAGITAKSVTITGLAAENKTYDGTTTVTVTGNPVISGKVDGDTVGVQAGSAAFADKNAGTNKTVNFNGYSLTGADAANYSLSQPTGIKADITAKPVTITGLGASDKTYDGTTAATVTGTPTINGMVSGDTVSVQAGSAAFADKNAGTNKTVTFTGYSLTGADAGNYSLSAQPASVTANITPSGTFVTYTIEDQTVVKALGLVGIDVPVAAKDAKDNEYPGTLEWYTDEDHTTVADDTAISQGTSGDEVTLCWVFNPDSDNFTDITGSVTLTLADTSITYLKNDGTQETVYYTADDVDQDLPKDSKANATFKGWKVGEESGTFTKLTQALFDAINGQDVSATPSFSTGGGGGGGGGGGAAPVTYTVTVAAADNGSASASVKKAEAGTTVKITVKPDQGYELDQLLVTDAKNKSVSVSGKDGSFSFTMPSSNVTVTPSFVKTQTPTPTPTPTPAQKFVDVPENAYYADAVYWAVDNGITSGTSATTFSPNDPCTRAQAVTFLWRSHGEPVPNTKTNPFTDVSSSAYYYNAVLWAVEKGITNGTTATTFSPDKTVSRGQMVSFLYRDAGSPAIQQTNPFTDVSSSDYYYDAVLWAVKNGITSGTSATTFSPGDKCLRSQIVTFLYRAAQ